MQCRSNYSITVEVRDGAPWAAILQDGAAVWSFGPYPSERDARRSARFRLAQHYSGSHKFGGRINLPGQLDLPQTEERLADLAKLKAAATPHQKPCNIGLFSDNVAQIDLLDVIAKR